MAFAQVVGQQLSGFIRQIKQNGARLKQAERRAAVGRLIVDNGRDFVIWHYGQKGRLELSASADIQAVKLILQAGLF